MRVSTFSAQNTRAYNGFELSAQARLPRGGFAFGGLTSDRTATNNCADLTNSNPNNRRFCNQVPRFRTLYKASGGYSLPFGVQLSATFQVEAEDLKKRAEEIRRRDAEQTQRKIALDGRTDQLNGQERDLADQKRTYEQSTIELNSDREKLGVAEKTFPSLSTTAT